MKKILFMVIAMMIISAIPMVGASQEPIIAERGYWYSSNSTALVAPGYDYVPLFVQFISEVPAEINDVNVSLNFTSGIFSYSYIHGPNRDVRDYYTFPVMQPGQEETIFQLTNISADYPSGMYQTQISYSFYEGGSLITGSSNLTVPVMGSVSIITQKAFFGTANSPLEVTSFENNVPFTLYIENNGNSPVTNVTVSYKPQYPFSGQQQNFTIPAFPSFYSLPLVFTVNTGNADMNTLQNITISYLGIPHTEQFTLSLSGFPHIVAAGSAFPVTSVVPAQGMNNVPVTFYLEEDSSLPVTNISVIYKPQYPFSGQQQTTVLSAIPSFGVEPVTFSVNIIGSENSTFQNISVYYNGSYHSLTYKIIIPGYYNFSIVNYYTNPPYIFQDQKFILLTVMIINGGNSISVPVNISLNSSMFNVTTLPYHLPALPPGKIMNFTFLMNAPSETGKIPLYLFINNNKFTLMENVYSKGNVTIQNSVPAVSPGTNKNLFKFTLTNTGKVALMDVSIHILTPDVFYIDVPSSNPLGSLTANNITFTQINPGQSIIITFLIDVRSATSPGNYPSQLFLSYRLNNSVLPIFQTYNFNVTVENTALQQITSGSALPYIIALFAVIIIVVFVAVIRRRKKK
ncbi:MAG: hypothetical protein ACP5MU_02580 [Thermoplasmata archaeon]